MVGCFNITASLDHRLCRRGSVHVLGQCAKWSYQHEIKVYFHFWLVCGSHAKSGKLVQDITVELQISAGCKLDY